MIEHPADVSQLDVQLVAPPHASAQRALQPWTRHVGVCQQSSAQSPPGQSIVHEVASLHSIVQPPPGQVKVQLAPPLQAILQPAPTQARAHSPAPPHPHAMLDVHVVLAPPQPAASATNSQPITTTASLIAPEDSSARNIARRAAVSTNVRPILVAALFLLALPAIADNTLPAAAAGRDAAACDGRDVVCPAAQVCTAGRCAAPAPGATRRKPLSAIHDLRNPFDDRNAPGCHIGSDCRYGRHCGAGHACREPATDESAEPRRDAAPERESARKSGARRPAPRPNPPPRSSIRDLEDPFQKK